MIGEDFRFVDVAQGDNSGWCKCKKCQKMYVAEGTHAAEVLTWINALSDELDVTYPGLYYGIFAYELTKKPPKTIRPNEHIYVTFCYDRSCSSHPLDGSRCTTSVSNWYENSELSAMVETWLSMTENVYVYYYGMPNLFLTMSYIHTVRDDVRFIHDKALVRRQVLFVHRRTVCDCVLFATSPLSSHLVWTFRFLSGIIVLPNTRKEPTMTNEKAAKDMKPLIEKNGFEYEGELTYDGRQIFTRRWKQKTRLAWYGECESTLEIKISMSCGIPLVRVIRDGRREDKARDYQSPKRAFNAIAEIVRCAGFEM